MAQNVQLDTLLKLLILLLIAVACIGFECCLGQQTHIKLEQGDVMGLKVFPDGARTSVYAFLGIPYAQPPVGELRFAASKPHPGWNKTLQAVSMQPICPQLSNTVYDESPESSPARTEATAEDCLYLNIWTPEAGMRYGNVPVLVVITGEEFAYDWPRSNRANGLDLAAEGVVVVSVQYRSNIYGWLSLGNKELPGNYGLSDIQLALRWLQGNVQSFGGNVEQLTLLGHGSSGAPLTLASVLISTQPLPKQLILMSPGPVLRALDTGHETRIVETSRILVQKLGCHFVEQYQQMVACLRRKSHDDLLRAYESVYNHGNGSLQLGALLPGGLVSRIGNATQLPTLLLGVVSNEGGFMQDYWLDLAREGPEALRQYINYTVLPNVLRSVDAKATGSLVEAIFWRYFSGEANNNVIHMLWGMQRLLSEALYETPFMRLLQLLDRFNGNYAYIFDHAHSMDMRGKRNLFGGASHSADLPLLLGPSLFQQIARRRFNSEEEQLCRKLRGAFANFVKSGNPTPGRIYDAWLPYTKQRPFIYSLGELSKKDSSVPLVDETQIEAMLHGEQTSQQDRSLSRPNRNEYKAPIYLLASNRKGNSYVANNQLDSGYGSHLRRVYGFWHLLVPTTMTENDEGSSSGNGALGQRVRLMEANADAARYRQGFYAMLGLVCLLLGCLCICVYLLRRDPLRIAGGSASEEHCCL
ncbi:acetylcholinesterase [Scaptodrosophila lebanonensis]|uniref:Acetylcholinesterase n=1 Tax=Drosophila lebanonensis TaxID=7225 RepID=A0A6J2UGM0_DROLE|nr:acetylcholinesterase [Scaptodrosophila lebanonensis]